jgi:hypothetical protein
VPAAGQIAQPYVGETVLDRAGALVAPWKAGRACTNENDCKPIIYHRKTGEIARFGDDWASDFVATGHGKEVWRAETAVAKAIRLQAPQTP